METLILPAASLVAVSLLLGWLAQASARDGLDRNALIGIRTKATMASDEAWYAGHRAAVSAVRAAAWICAAAGLVAGVLAIVGTRLAVVVVIAGYAALLGLMTLAAIRAGRAARAV
ncbi:SdpI family protein [Aeromicrobium wangtongii]|uniref:SdpI family protein n=1 Tax=Aeromicrobium wangtongii TaxID=2969247 RepID=A0ABY5M2F4_9ACTN|nr:SdpI family protein [Aeromicrobium wangtongii]MCD9198348.1 SdpI family protein [Aeromicrobium wangtongii]UUP12379.1 SdpI family protein [Aeromicrobium wangtongii]